ncbi:uncharacterized protein SPPG_01354 [Spizellomyces punctatus DAOM BR117]|uniref:Uncharacterized protein n=1 Tax=Spizellomyces punctatus (strain DAOM BR117) TaxID=645134 RepID=A0A0L0HR93_SPIPD|nr:uncharacterized protein SPPG_01354 [Spizellomyces punctatus DAOM BR117]KND03901.1 hypothetical protein SPPG_01354 [Spizellomyces punctatus DAOM BR117]|eukprot:XP_016611940.1 hypothetical protein SPPG_01354 [Spizellomyces punctatus DAOM BR117]
MILSPLLRRNLQEWGFPPAQLISNSGAESAPVPSDVFKPVAEFLLLRFEPSLKRICDDRGVPDSQRLPFMASLMGLRDNLETELFEDTSRLAERQHFLETLSSMVRMNGSIKNNTDADASLDTAEPRKSGISVSAIDLDTQLAEDCHLLDIFCNSHLPVATSTECNVFDKNVFNEAVGNAAIDEFDSSTLRLLSDRISNEQQTLRLATDDLHAKQILVDRDAQDYSSPEFISQLQALALSVTAQLTQMASLLEVEVMPSKANSPGSVRAVPGLGQAVSAAHAQNHVFEKILHHVHAIKESHEASLQALQVLESNQLSPDNSIAESRSPGTSAAVEELLSRLQESLSLREEILDDMRKLEGMALEGTRTESPIPL